ncbi:hypothetical protein GPECTOR_35g864 [Gonium pectorale]|uniref:Uncharacterized protein n=1 Tax=Gonium pectorale TaxID=33097 RepID=A0A150GC47_GONPE|nr:hypothetical protein GPECTOR_35g864 [Gonium pectorale]|eukprot:KXZ47426.1 hypothetical protein GPECTOR_35g864 [Gonium pectorale]
MAQWFHGAARAAMVRLFPPYVAARLKVVLMGGGAGARAELQARLAALQADAGLARWADASKARHKLLRETLLALLQRSEDIAYGAGEEVGCGSEEDAARELSRWSLEEKARAGSQPRTSGSVGKPAVRGDPPSSNSSERFTAEGAAAAMKVALSAVVAGRATPTPQEAAAAGEDTVVVTVMLVASGVRLLPRRGDAAAGLWRSWRGGRGSGRRLANPEELCEALLGLGELLEDDLVQLEVVWAPKARGESLSWRQLQLGYEDVLPL